MTSRQQYITVKRREFLAIAGLAGLQTIFGTAEASAEVTDPLIARISRAILWEGRKGGANTTWFHPRACMMPRADGPEGLMTLQKISGSDVFGPVHWSSSTDGGRTWSDPLPIPGLGRRAIGPDRQEGTCDVVPDYHEPTNTVLAMGHNVYYQRGVLARPQGPRHPVYVVRDASGKWSAPRKLDWNDPRGTAIYTSGCSQRIMLPGGDVLLPMSFGPAGRRDRSVATARCKFDGHTLSIAEVGNELRNTAGRGLLEPSLAVLDGRYTMTLRAEDGRGYVTASFDGLQWDEPRAWAWDDGSPLGMSTTQQHWLTHGDELFLVYTRQAKENANVFRWRAPLYLAAVDRKTLRLRRDTEQVVFPLIGDGINQPDHVARMGNFHVTSATLTESWITVGETLPHDHWQGNLLLGRIHWGRPNALIPNR